MQFRNEQPRVSRAIQCEMGGKSRTDHESPGRKKNVESLAELLFAVSSGGSSTASGEKNFIGGCGWQRCLAVFVNFPKDAETRAYQRHGQLNFWTWVRLISESRPSKRLSWPWDDRVWEGRRAVMYRGSCGRRWRKFLKR